MNGCLEPVFDTRFGKGWERWSTSRRLQPSSTGDVVIVPTWKSGGKDGERISGQPLPPFHETSILDADVGQAPRDGLCVHPIHFF